MGKERDGTVVSDLLRNIWKELGYLLCVYIEHLQRWRQQAYV